MTVAANVIKQFFESDFNYLGAGFYACVFASNNPNLVYKIGKTVSDPFLSYIKAFKGYNKHVPEIYDIYEDKDFYLVTMERLKEVENRKISSDFRNLRLFEYEDTVSDLVFELKDIADENEYILDLHSNNVMRRGDTLVITDPFASSEIWDEVGIDSWVDDFLSENVNGN